MGQNIKEILPPSVPALEAQRKAPSGTGSHTNETEPQCFGVWCLLGDTAPAQGHPGPAGKPPCLPPCWSLPKPSHHHPSHGGSLGNSAARTERPGPCPGSGRGRALAEPPPRLGRWVLQVGPVLPSPPLHELLGDGVGVEAPAAGAQGGIAQVQVRGPAVHVVLGEGRGPGQVVGVEHVGFLPGFAGQALLREALVLHQVRVVGVLPALRRWQRVLRERRDQPQLSGTPR